VKNQRGSFLIEAMVAVVILSCALVVLIRSLTGAITTARAIEGYTQAVVLLGDELDALIAKKSIDRRLRTTYEKSAGDYVFEISVAAKPVTGRLMNEVTIRVAWPSGASHQRMISAATYLLDSQWEDHAS